MARASVQVRTVIDAHVADALRLLMPGSSMHNLAQTALLEYAHRLVRQHKDITGIAKTQAPLPEPQPLPPMPPAWGMTEEDLS